MTPEIHAQELRYSLNGNGYVCLKVFVVKRISTINLKTQPVYLIKTVLKVSIYNNQDFNINPGPVTSYMNYPAMFSFTKSLTCSASSQSANFKLLNYSPITVNSSITTSRSDVTDNTQTNSSQQSVGSSSSQTNSFGVDVQAGWMMESPLLSIGLSYDHAYTSANSQERTTAQGSSASQQNGIADSYSIKDWGIYAKVNREDLQTTWVCAQEYPWDILQYRSADGTGNIDLPQPIVDRMLVGDCVLPPSQLSQFGTDFTFTADWSFMPSEFNVDVTTPLLSFDIDTAYVLGSHQRTGDAPPYSLAASLGQSTTNSNSLALTWWQLECLALDAIVPGRNDASANFDKLPASRFPASSSVPLVVMSPTNTLLCVAPGFSPGMIVDVAKNDATYTLAFKVLETVGEITLYLKHWKLDPTGVVVNIEVNGAALPAQYVDAVQGAGGMANRTDITLRSTDYMAEDFSDYLVVGLNTVVVTVSASEASVPADTARYCLAAVVVS
ncbi:hypothetical protein [Burkholderia anthina]|uniref:hypothetical protein n=1 Tax=Burkholderia anthina TaxID=179879 RepID=UPI00158C800B|nr:hypothetical protein [Burkholderia anthina]